MKIEKISDETHSFPERVYLPIVSCVSINPKGMSQSEILEKGIMKLDSLLAQRLPVYITLPLTKRDLCSFCSINLKDVVGRVLKKDGDVYECVFKENIYKPGKGIRLVPHIIWKNGDVRVIMRIAYGERPQIYSTKGDI